MGRRIIISLVVIVAGALLIGFVTHGIQFTSKITITPPTRYALTGKVHITIGSGATYGTADLIIADNGNDHLEVTLDPNLVKGTDLHYSEDADLDAGSISIGYYGFGSNAKRELTILVNEHGFAGKGYHIAENTA